MGILDDLKNVRLSVCREFIEKEFSGGIILKPSTENTYLTAWEVGPVEGEGDRVMQYNVDEVMWEGMEDFHANINITHDGKLYVSYPFSDPEDSGMCFRVDHPREASELLNLFMRPKSCTQPDVENEPCREYRLGELFNFLVPMPCGDSWRVLHPSILQSGELDSLSRMLYNALVRDIFGFAEGDVIQAGEFAERWPAFVGDLPDATVNLREGYLLNLEGGVRSAVDLVITKHDPGNMCLDFLLIPKKGDVSYLYLREMLNKNVFVRKAIRSAIKGSNNLDALIKGLEDVPVRIPPRYHHQIRLVAESQSVREWLRYLVERLSHQNSREQNWHLAHLLHQLVK